MGQFPRLTPVRLSPQVPDHMTVSSLPPYIVATMHKGGQEAASTVGKLGACYDPWTCRAPIFLFPSCPLSLLTHLGPLPSDSHRPLPIYSTDPLMHTLVL